MVKRTGTIIRKSRSKRTKNIRDKGKISLTTYFQSFKTGDKVYLKANPSIQEGIFAFRFQGKIGTVKAKTGRCYSIAIKDGKKEKQLYVHPIHMRKV